MKTKLLILIPLVSLIFMTGCTQKTTISMKVPGELNVKGIHKIAILDFSSVKSNKELGIYSASSDLLKLAKDEVANTFYNEPYYQFSNLEVEKGLAKKSNASSKTIFDGMIYGKLWWKVTPEYRNIIPSKKNLETYRMVTYVSGRSKKGKAYYSSAHITTKTQDKAFNMHYRVKNATLMMSLNLYKISKDGVMSKVTEVFEVAKGKYEITNGAYKSSTAIIAEHADTNKMATLTKKEKGMFGNMMSGFSKKSKKVNSDMKISSNISTIPSEYTMGQALISKITSKLQKMIAPTRQDFEIEIEKGDSKVEKMFDYSAFNSISSYIQEQVLAKGKDEFYDSFDDPEDFIKNTKELLAFIDKNEFDKENNLKKAEDKKVYEVINDKDLTKMAKDSLSSDIKSIYNYALATESIGNFEKSLYIYRYLFNADNQNQLYANGIGRSLLALDMGSKLTESTRNKRKAKKANTK